MAQKQKLNGTELPLFPAEFQNYTHFAVFKVPITYLDTDRPYYMLLASSKSIYFSTERKNFLWYKEGSQMAVALSEFLTWTVASDFGVGAESDEFIIFEVEVELIWANNSIAYFETNLPYSTPNKQEILRDAADAPVLLSTTSRTCHQGEYVNLSCTAAVPYQPSNQIAYEWYEKGKTGWIGTEQNYVPDTNTVGTKEYYCFVTSIRDDSKTANITRFIKVEVIPEEDQIPNNAELLLGYHVGSYIKRQLDIRLPKPLINLNFENYKKNNYEIQNSGRLSVRGNAFVDTSEGDANFEYGYGLNGTKGILLENKANFSIPINTLELFGEDKPFTMIIQFGNISIEDRNNFHQLFSTNRVSGDTANEHGIIAIYNGNYKFFLNFAGAKYSFDLWPGDTLVITYKDSLNYSFYINGVAQETFYESDLDPEKLNQIEKIGCGNIIDEWESCDSLKISKFIVYNEYLNSYQVEKAIKGVLK